MGREVQRCCHGGVSRYIVCLCLCLCLECVVMCDGWMECTMWMTMVLVLFQKFQFEFEFDFDFDSDFFRME